MFHDSIGSELVATLGKPTTGDVQPARDLADRGRVVRDETFVDDGAGVETQPRFVGDFGVVGAKSVEGVRPQQNPLACAHSLKRRQNS
jgi:hypothetical protein